MFIRIIVIIKKFGLGLGCQFSRARSGRAGLSQAAAGVRGEEMVDTELADTDTGLSSAAPGGESSHCGGDLTRHQRPMMNMDQ